MPAGAALHARVDGAALVDQGSIAAFAVIAAAVVDPCNNDEALRALAVAQPGTPFQQRVWAAVRAIPVGTTTTYTALATSLGEPASAARAVAAACGDNDVAVVVLGPQAQESPARA